MELRKINETIRNNKQTNKGSERKAFFWFVTNTPEIKLSNDNLLDQCFSTCGSPDCIFYCFVDLQLPKVKLEQFISEYFFTIKNFNEISISDRALRYCIDWDPRFCGTQFSDSTWCDDERFNSKKLAHFYVYKQLFSFTKWASFYESHLLSN